MGTKSCTKILNFSTRFSCENLAVEDFVTLLMGKKSCWWGNVMFGHNFGILVMLFYAGEIQIQTHCRRLERATYFFLTQDEVCKSRQSCTSTVPQPVKHRRQRMYVEVLP